MFFYTSKGSCTSKAYLQYLGNLPPEAYFDGSTIWGPSPTHAVIKIQSYSLGGPPGSGTPAAGPCEPYGDSTDGYPVDVTNAVPIDMTNHGFRPPFSLK
jgi:hypothetical protein